MNIRSRRPSRKAGATGPAESFTDASRSQFLSVAHYCQRSQDRPRKQLLQFAASFHRQMLASEKDARRGQKAG